MAESLHGERCSVPSCDQPAVLLAYPDGPDWFYVCERHENLAPMSRVDALKWLGRGDV